MSNRFLITGANGQLARAFQKVLTAQGGPYTALSHNDLDITKLSSLESCVQKIRPQIILNCASYNNVDAAEQDDSNALAVNGSAVKNLAKICRDEDIFLVHFSTDAVFDGKKGALYTEDDQPNPINNYGKSKLVGEQYLVSSGAKFLLFRVSWVFGEGESNFLVKLRSLISKPGPLRIVCDRFSVPTSANNIAQITIKAINAELKGLFHLVNSGYASRYEFARIFLKVMDIEKKLFPALSSQFADPARRPFFSAMSNQKLSKALNISIPHWQDSLIEYLKSAEFKQ